MLLSSLWEGTVTKVVRILYKCFILIGFIGVISQKEAVRLAVTKLLSSIMPYLSDVLITNRIVPALVTLSNDFSWLVIKILFIYTYIFFL